MFSALPADLRIVRVKGFVDSKNDLIDRPILRAIPSIDGGFDTAVSMASAAIEACRDRPPTIVLAAGPRFSNFVTGYYVARWAKSKLALLYMDEWCVRTPPFVSVTDTDRKWERDCLQAATAVCYVTEGKRAAYEDTYPFLRSKPSIVCPNGWDEAPFAKARFDTSHLRDYKEHFSISFVGTAAHSAPIHSFLDSLEIILRNRLDIAKRIKLLLVGNQPDDVQSRIGGFSNRHPNVAQILPAVSYSNAVEIMRESSALLLLCTTQYPGIVPQKTYDYLNVTTPILAYGANSDAVTIVETAQAGIVVRDLSPRALETALDSLMSTPKAKWESPARRSSAAQYSRQVITRGLLEQLTQLAAGSPQ